jgi:signal transduction histidine kinase
VGTNPELTYSLFNKIITTKIIEYVIIFLILIILLLHLKNTIISNMKFASTSRNEFIKEIKSVVGDSISNMRIYCDLIKKFVRNEIDLGSNPKRQEDLINKVVESLENLSYNISGDLAFASLDLNKLIENSIDIKRFDFYLTRTRLKVKLDKNLPPIEICPLQIKQVMVDLLTLSLDYTTKWEVVKITTTYKKSEEGEFAEIKIEDEGHMFGLENIKRISKKFSDESNNLGLDVNSFNINAVEQFIEKNHGGKLLITINDDKRREIIVSLPYERDRDTSGDNDFTTLGENVIKLFERR